MRFEHLANLWPMKLGLTICESMACLPSSKVMISTLSYINRSGIKYNQKILFENLLYGLDIFGNLFYLLHLS